MHTLLRFTLAAAIATSMLACRDDLAPTGIKPPAQASKDFVVVPIIIDWNQFVEITAGDNFTCARRLSGIVLCWGENTLGQTGRIGSRGDCYGLRTPICTPTPSVVSNPQGGWLLASKVDAGGSHACVVDFNKAPWCWGAGGAGQLGINPAWVTSAPPTMVAGPITVNTISAGTNSTCAQLTNGDVSCWGLINFAATPVKFTNSPGTIRSLAVGALHACFIPFQQMSVTCFGEDRDGQGGHAPTTPPFVTTQPTLFGSFVANVLTQDNTTCVNQFSGTVQCAGFNTAGMLGNGNASIGSSTVPVDVGANGVAQALRAVTVGKEHACALDPNGAAFCWGSGKKGELGDGRNQSSSVPVAVAGGHSFVGIAAGFHHTCAITSSEIWCWGDNFFSQLGMFTSPAPGSPTRAL